MRRSLRSPSAIFTAIGQSWFEAGLAQGAAVVFVLTAGGAAFAQSAERPKFEVASIKPTPEALRDSASMIPSAGGRIHVGNYPTRMLIMRAYHLQESQIVGGPEWLRDEGFDIEAKADANAKDAEMMLMLQSLLEERFHLSYHRETREQAVYALTPGKGGLKLPAPKEGGCVKIDGPAPPPVGARAVPCGRLSTQMGPSGMAARGGDLPMKEFVRALEGMLGRPLLDKTGVTAHFDVNLEFSVDDTLAGLASSWGSVRGHREAMMQPAGAGGAPNIFAALQDQLGLKLEAAKGPAEVMVIDHVERPSGN
jgi:uncharacterized protein (TIGR03435 family)